jgi:hypothetical protein
MSRRKKVGAMSTGMTIALIGGGVVLLYLVMSKSSTTTPTATLLPAGTVLPATAAIQAQASTTNTEVNDASSTVNNLINSIFS